MRKAISRWKLQLASLSEICYEVYRYEEQELSRSLCGSGLWISGEYIVGAQVDRRISDLKRIYPQGFSWRQSWLAFLSVRQQFTRPTLCFGP